MARYFTGKGDDGSTGVLAKGRLSKSDKLIEAIGCVDELNSSIGMALLYTHVDPLRKELKEIQNELFIIGANLASLQARKIEKARLGPRAKGRLELFMKTMSGEMPELRQFVIPGGGQGAVHLHMSRAIARRTERAIVEASKEYKIDSNVIAYANRLSSFLFVSALYVNYKEGREEEHPTY